MKEPMNPRGLPVALLIIVATKHNKTINKILTPVFIVIMF